MTAPRLHHTGITVADLERSIAFYRDLLGLALLGRGEEDGPELSELLGLEGVKLRWAELELGAGQRLELLEYLSPQDEPLEPRPPRPGATHLALAVDELAPLQRRLADAGLLVSADVVVLTEEGEWNGVHTLYARDPDGAFVELVERRSVVRLPDETEDAAVDR